MPSAHAFFALQKGPPPPPRPDIVVEPVDGESHALFPKTAHQEGRWVAQATGRLFRPFATDMAGQAAAAVNAFSRKGERFPECLEGDGCVILYDRHERRLIAANDRFQVSRIYYCQHPGGLVLADSYSPLFQLGVQPRPNPRKHLLFVASNYRRFEDLRGETFYHGVLKLPAAGRLVHHRGRTTVDAYWRLPLQDIGGASPQELGDQFLSRLLASVASRLAACRAPAFTLSSGMDSSSIVCLAAELLGRKVPLYTTTYSEETEYNEDADVAVMAARFGSQWRKVFVSGDEIFPAMLDTLAQASEPYPTVTQLMHYFIARAARADGCDSLFSGLGGDEANAGEIEEYLFFFADLRSQGDLEGLRRHMEGWRLFHDHPLYPKNEEVLMRFFQQQIDFSRPGRNFPNPAYHQPYRKAFRPSALADAPPPPELEHPYGSYLLNKLFQDLFFEVVPSLLAAEGANSRMCGIPTLYPYLEPETMSYGFSIPLREKYSNGMSKALLRRALAGRLPEEVLRNGRKRGWNAPFNQWLAKSIRPHVERLIQEPSRRQSEVYDLAAIDALLQEHCQGRANHMMFFWQLISYEMWYDKHIPTDSRAMQEGMR